MGPSSKLPYGHQSYMLCGPLFCFGEDYFEPAGRQAYPLAWLASRPCLVWWLLAHWQVGPIPSVAGCVV